MCLEFVMYVHIFICLFLVLATISKCSVQSYGSFKILSYFTSDYLSHFTRKNFLNLMLLYTGCPLLHTNKIFCLPYVTWSVSFFCKLNTHIYSARSKIICGFHLEGKTYLGIRHYPKYLPSSFCTKHYMSKLLQPLVLTENIHTDNLIILQ